MQAALLAAVAIGGGLSAMAQIRAGQAESVALKEKATQEQDSARDREIQRRRQLIRTLASQNAIAGASGVDPTAGSMQAIALRDIRDAETESIMDRSVTGRRTALLRMQAKQAKQQGYLGAGATVLDTAFKVGSNM